MAVDQGASLSESVDFSISPYKKDLIETAIREKIHLAETLNESLASPIWIYRLVLISGGLIVTILIFSYSFKGNSDALEKINPSL